MPSGWWHTPCYPWGCSSWSWSRRRPFSSRPSTARSASIALTLGLLLTGIATFQADVFPRPAAVLLLGAMAGFLFVFFVAEFLPPAAGQLGTATFGVLLALGFAWIGVALWLRSPAA